MPPPRPQQVNAGPPGHGVGYTNPAFMPGQQVDQPQQAGVGYYPNQPIPYAEQQPPQQTIVLFEPETDSTDKPAETEFGFYCGMIVFSCLVLWFCNPLFGLIAFILSVFAKTAKADGRSEALKLGKASMWMSIFGVIVTVAIVAVGLGLFFGFNQGQWSKSRHDRYVSASSCCQLRGYYYPGYGEYCYSDVHSTGSSCPSYTYFVLGTCYSSQYWLKSGICCYSYESYSLVTNYCIGYY